MDLNLKPQTVKASAKNTEKLGLGRLLGYDTPSTSVIEWVDKLASIKIKNFFSLQDMLRELKISHRLEGNIWKSYIW